MVTSLQTVRRQLGYTAAQVIDLLTRRADALHLPIANKASLKTKLSSAPSGRNGAPVPIQMEHPFRG